MTQAVNFCGASGASYRFDQVREDGDWRDASGVVLFASGDCSGWRIIEVAEHPAGVSAETLDWRWRKARRYGASAIFVRRSTVPGICQFEADDLRLGLDPVFGAPLQRGSLAA
jgi:hypothetical protein